MRDGEVRKVKKESKRISLKHSVGDRKDKADKVKHLMNARGGSSSELVSSNFPITSPFQYESGYKQWSWTSVPSYSELTYKTQYDYSNVNEACGPIAATNLMIYWKNREPSKFSGLMRGDSTWNTTFNDLRGRMHFF